MIPDYWNTLFFILGMLSAWAVFKGLDKGLNYEC